MKVTPANERVDIAPPEIVCHSRPGQPERWLAFSDHMGLIEIAASREACEQQYTSALVERRPLTFPWETLDSTERVSQPQLNFDVFHPLDHWAGSIGCWGWYGGLSRHLALWWDYQVDFLHPRHLWHALACRLGHHVAIDTWTPSPRSRRLLNRGGLCLFCYTLLPRPWESPPPGL